MTSTSSIVQVTIDRQTKAVTQAGFGLPLFLGLHKAWIDRYRTYSDLASVGVDFPTNSNEYIAAQAFFGQAISVSTIAIGRQDSTIVTYTPVVANNTSYSVQIGNGTTYSNTYTYISDSTALATEIITGLTTLINADSSCPVTASGTSTLILTAKVGGTPFAALPSTNLTPVYTTAETLTTALNTVQLANNDWYGLVAYSHVKADVLEIAAWAQGAKKFYSSSSSDATIINTTLSSDTTSIATALKTAGYDHVQVMYSGSPSLYPEAALQSVFLSQDAGANIQAFKALAGIPVDNLTDTQANNARSKYANTYELVGGQNIILNGQMSDGTYADIIRDIDWIKANLITAIYSRLVNLGKIAYTDAGISVIEQQIRNVLKQAQDKGILADDPAYTVTVPKAVDAAPNDRANRFLNNVYWTARVAGAIQSVSVAGTISV